MKAEQWNASYPPGTHVAYTPVIGETDGAMTTRTRSEAWELGHGDSVVKIEGRLGGVLLDCLTVLSNVQETSV